MIFVTPCIVTLLSMIFIRGQSIFRYGLIFLLALLGSYATKCHCEEEHDPKNAYPGIMSEAEIKEHFDAAVRYAHLGYQFLNEAQDECKYMPDINVKRVTKDLMKALIVSLGGTTAKAKLILSFFTAIASYAEDVFEYWEDYEYAMNQSAYYFEMSAMEQDVVFYNRLENRGPVNELYEKQRHGK